MTAMLQFRDGSQTEQGSPQDKATWWTCKKCGFRGPHVGSDAQGKPACLESCGGADLNPDVPRLPEHWKALETEKKP